MIKKTFFGALIALSFAGAVCAQSLNPTPGASQLDNSSALTAAKRTADALAPQTLWNYAGVTGGITDTTAVTIKAAPTNYNRLKSIQFSNSGAGTSEFTVNCGAAGTVLYRGFVQAAAATQVVTFPYPLVCAALLEVKLGSGTTMLFRFNAQGSSW